MKILITGICGFVGHRLAHSLKRLRDCELIGMDNLIRPGSGTHVAELKKLGVRLYHGDIRMASDLEVLPKVNWVIDAAAQPSVLAGVDGRTSSRQLVQHNLYGTVNLLEFCRTCGAGFILLSTSRVYTIPPLAGLAMEVENEAFKPRKEGPWPTGISPDGVDEKYATSAPVSLYGATKVASEAMAREYGQTFGFPVWINRCGVLAGAGQFGRPDQGIFAFLASFLAGPGTLRYIGFGGKGYQVRDCLHPDDLAALLDKQMQSGADRSRPEMVNVSGGTASACSLRQLSTWCEERWGPHEVAASSEERPFDIPWIVLNHRRASEVWDWRPERCLDSILEEIAQHADAHPDWLNLSAPW